MESLFEEIKFEDNPNPEKGLKIIQGKKQPLSKNQQNFNKLTKKVEYLRDEIVGRTEKLNNLLIAYSKKIPPLKTALAEKQLQLARTLGNSVDIYKFSRRQQDDIGEVIVDLCNAAFAAIEPDDDAKKFYDSWSDMSYDEEVLFDKELLAEQFAAMTGINLDINDFSDTAEANAKLFAKIRDGFENIKESETEKKNKRKKTKKQLEKEKLQESEENLKLKSIRSIYLLLAKALHPDVVSDPEEKAHNEELMKKVTSAYDNKDLATLLKLEMEWVASESNNIQNLSDDRIKLYIASLKEQVRELEERLALVSMHPRFEPVTHLAGFSPMTATRKLNELAEEYKETTAANEDYVKIFSQPNAQKEIKHFVSVYLKNLKKEIDDFPFLHW